MIPAYPKIFALGTRYIQDIFKEEVEITEKLDGSQFAFGVINGELVVRSKGRIIYTPDAMFKAGFDFVESRFKEGLLSPNIVYYGEYFQKPKHNALAYARIPTNGIALFGVHLLKEDRWLTYPEMCAEAAMLHVEVVPFILRHVLKSSDDVIELLDRKSGLGLTKIEGVVVKNLTRPCVVGDLILPFMSGKLVGNHFREVNKIAQRDFRGEGAWETVKAAYRTEPRWLKAVQHLRERGVLSEDLRDIGPLITEVRKDIETEEREQIKEHLWKLHSGELLRASTAGLPEWYKEQLLKRGFANETNGS